MRQLAEDVLTMVKFDSSSLIVDGSGDTTLVFLHGWPDGPALWDGTVAHLKDRFRCVRFALPGFGVASVDGASGPCSLQEMTAYIARVVDTVSPQGPVVLVMHDWGCIFGYEYAQQFPARVQRLVAVDIGDYNSGSYQRSLSVRQRAGIFAYQFWLAMAWGIGRWGGTALANRMTRWMAQSMRCPTPAASIVWPMNFPYSMQWFGLRGGFRQARPVKPGCPVLYLYGSRKPFMFHSPRWLARLEQQPGSAVIGLRCGHWVMLNQAEAFHTAVRKWLLDAA